MMGIMISGFYAIIALVISQFVLSGVFALAGNKEYLKEFPLQLKSSIMMGVKEASSLVLLLSLMGVIVAVLNVSGRLTLKMTTALTELAGNNLPYLIALVSMVCFLFGMGVPTVAAYLMVAIMAAPALLEFGIEPVVSHFFVFYLAILSGLTPPVALNIAVASKVAQSPFWETGPPLPETRCSFVYPARSISRETGTSLRRYQFII